MPERWQREVRKLGGLMPSNEVWRRAEQGPQAAGGSDLPPRRQRLVAGAVAFVVFIAAGSFAWRAFRPTQAPAVASIGAAAPTIQVTLRAFKMVATNGVPTLTATMRVGDRTVLGVTAPFPYPNPLSTVHNGLGPPFIDQVFVPVARGSLMAVTGDARSVDAGLQEPGAFPFRPILSLGRLDGAVAIDQSPGRYVLSLTGNWAEGSATFYFPIELVEGLPGVTVPLTGAPTLNVVGKNAPTVTLGVADRHQDGVRTDYTWCDTPDGCVNGIADFATYPPPVDYLEVMSGAPIVITGDATAIAGVFRRVGAGGGGDIYLDEGVIPGTPGRYVLQLNAAFDRGEATFFLGVEVTPAHW